MREKNTLEELATLDALIKRVRQFHGLSPEEQKQVLDAVGLWLMRDQQTLADSARMSQPSAAAFKEPLSWCQTDDYCYKDWK